MPWLPSLAILLVIFSASNVPPTDWVRYAVWLGILTLAYLLYAMPASYMRHYRLDFAVTEQLK